MDIFDYYKTDAKRAELKSILDYAAQNSERGLGANFLEKDIRGTEEHSTAYGLVVIFFDFLK